MGKGQFVGVAYTAKQRKQKSLQSAAIKADMNAEDLVYIEHEASKTARVETTEGRVIDRFHW